MIWPIIIKIYNLCNVSRVKNLFYVFYFLFVIYNLKCSKNYIQNYIILQMSNELNLQDIINTYIIIFFIINSKTDIPLRRPRFTHYRLLTQHFLLKIK